MRNHLAVNFVLISCLSVAGAKLGAQMLPQVPTNGTSVVRNDATTSVTIEYRNKDNKEWRQLKLETAKDTMLAGDRIRVATTRDDKAVVTVDLPILPGKKYRLVWNAQAGIWDFSSVL